MRAPTLSVGLPVYNGERYLSQCLDSLLSQDFQDFELIISNNGSTDRTAQICREYALRDSRIRYFEGEVNRGATWNFRRVSDLANGSYFKWAFYDDLCHPTMFRRCIDEFARSDPSVVLVFPRSQFIDENGAELKVRESPRWDRIATTARTPYRRLAHVIRWLAHGQAIFGVIRLDALRQTTPPGCVAMDWVKIAELAMLGKIKELPDILIQVRIHEENSAKSNKSWSALLAWHDPDRTAQDLPPPFNVAIVLEYLKSVSYLPLSFRDKILCRVVVCFVWCFRLIWMRIQKLTGPARIWLQARTGWRRLSAIGDKTGATHR